MQKQWLRAVERLNVGQRRGGRYLILQRICWRRSLLTYAGCLKKGGVVLLRYRGNTYGLFARLH